MLVANRQLVPGALRELKAGCSSRVYGTGPATYVVDSSATACNSCVQWIALGKVAEGLTNASDFCVGVIEPVLEFLHGHQVGDNLLKDMSK
jgi:hypothetical protein